ncbi:MAG: tRNA (N(6)-L-threonylcarbamoyladenosine(37)-C(2))-methylthiotransferase MtaB [Candidatus Omnitrophica bacterium]|nr:tRNA (N(6)-L-threonylcarbamoyladenosine(37)-C(2))-methylthiotransferase MtaB [Candidatus Omnitrophota bacterium]
MNTKISFYTFGCRLNQSETAVVQQTFKIDGEYKIVDFGKPADVVVVNTCTVTENGDTDTRKLINKINRTNPKARIALLGCQAQIQKDRLTALPNVNWVIGNARKMDFLSILKEEEAPKAPRVITPAIPRESFEVPATGIDPTHTRANIKIQDGCDFFCSYCEIPYARGRARSRTFSDIIREAAALAAAGHKELVITGINVGTYKNSKKTIIDVIDALEQINGLKRIRISSIEPTTISFELIKKMTKPTKLCRHLHIPLQSGNDQILKKMRRKYSVEEFGRFIHRAYDTVPQICIGTDVIVGFPGEADEFFEETAEHLREWPIHYFHVFSYSQRNMAKSQKLPEALSQQKIAARSAVLRELGLRKRRVFYKSFIGTKQKVLFEQSKKGYWTGLTDHYIRVKVKSDRKLNNAFLKIKMETLDRQAIIGTLDQPDE